jgi:hypothetical protein
MLQVPQRISGWLLSGKGDLVRAYVANALRDHTDLVAAATTVAVTVSAGVLLTLSGPRADERPARVPVPASAVERAPQEGAPQRPVFAVSPTTPTSTHGPSGNESEPGDRRGPNRSDSRDLGRPDGPGENDQVMEEGSDDQVVNEGSDDQVVEEGNDPHGQSEDPHGQSEDPHGQSEDPHGQNEDPHGQNEGPHGQNQNNDDQGESESEGDQAEDNDDQGEGEDDQGAEEGNDDQASTTDPITPL